MAKVATAYVDIRPDLTGFSKELKAKLKALAPVTFKVGVDSNTLAQSVGKLANDSNVKASVDKAASGMSSQLADKVGEQFVEDFDVDTSKMTVKGRRIGEIMADGMAEAGEEAGDRFTEIAAKEIDKTLNDRLRQPFDNFRRQSKLDMRIAAEDAAREFRDKWRERFGDLEIDRDTLRSFERSLGQRFGEAGASAARSMGAEVQREWNNVLSGAFKENESRDKKAAAALAKRLAGTVVSEFTSALAATTSGWSKLLTNPIGLALVATVGTVSVMFVSALVTSIVAALSAVAVIGLGGLLLKSRPDVADAGGKLGETFMSEFGKAALPMERFLIRGFETLQTMIPDIAQKASAIFGALGPQVVNLARGVGGFVDKFVAGLQRGLPGLKAASDALSVGLPKLGEAIGDIFEKLGEDPEALKSAIEGTIVVIVNLTNVIGSLASTSIQWFNKMRTGWRNFTSLVDAFNPGKLFSGMGDRSPMDMFFNKAAYDETNRGLKTFWNNFSGHSDAAADKVKADAQKIADAISSITNKVKASAPERSFQHIEQAISEVSAKFNMAAEDSEWFRQRVVEQLAAIQAQVDKSNWDTFRQDAASGFVSINAEAVKAREAVDKLIDSMDILNDRFITGEEAVSKFEDVNDQLAEAIKEGAFGIDLQTEAGRKNREMLRSQAQSIEDIIKSQLKQGKTWKDIQPEFARLTKQWQENADNIGFSTEGAKEYARELGLLPENILTELALAGDQEAKDALAELGKPITTTIMAEATTSGKGSPGSVATYMVEAMRTGGAAAGLSYDEWFAKGVENNKEIAKRAANTVAFEAGTGINNKLAAGINSNVSVVVDAARIAANKVRDAANGVSLFGSGASMMSTLAAGINSRVSVVVEAARIAAQRIKDQYPNSPKAKEGPLSGKGDTYYSGQTITRHLADGMVNAEPYVVNASRQLAGSMSMGAMNGAYSATRAYEPAVNVYIGTERLDERIDYRVDSNNETMARTLVAGRSGV